jgi:ubiquinone/menaquinone biosynthesis C-methylase UbiE
MSITLVDRNQAEAYDRLYGGGFDHMYPDLDVVRLERWYFGHRPGLALDYGCGTGENSLHLLRCGYAVHALDASRESVRLVERKFALHPEWRDRAWVWRVDPDALRLPFGHDTFDYVVCVSVLSELVLRKRIELLLAEFQRVLKPGAKMIVSVQGQGSLYASQGRPVGDDAYEFTGATETGAPSSLHYIARSEAHMREFLGGFTVDDMGFSAFKYANVDEFEYIACVRKP